jgi:molybdopterin-guanine dinucleotide biosynthesis protein A
MLDIPCVIVAGGKSSRMGRDKALLPFGSFPTLTQYQLARLQNNFSSLHVSCKNKNKFDFEASFIEDTQEFDAFSPLVALYSILCSFQTPIAILSVDTPFVTVDEFTELFEALDEQTDIVIARSPFGSHQMCGIYKPTITSVLKEQIEKNIHKIRSIFEKVHVRYVDFKDDSIFENLNHPLEYEKAKERVCKIP